MAYLEWIQVQVVAKSLFPLFRNEGDYLWFKENYGRLSWQYTTDLELEKLKIQLCAIAQVYYEFCYQAYGMPVMLSEEIEEQFAAGGLPFNQPMLSQLAGSDPVLHDINESEGEEGANYRVRDLVYSLAQRMEGEIFEQLYSHKDYDYKALYASFVAIIPDIYACDDGRLYLLMRCTSFVN